MAVRQRGWWALSERERRQVRKCARRGERHPDPEIASAAEEWARSVLKPADSVPRAAFGAAVNLLIDALTGGGGWLGSMLSERRYAKKILKAV